MRASGACRPRFPDPLGTVRILSPVLDPETRRNRADSHHRRARPPLQLQDPDQDDSGLARGRHTTAAIVAPASSGSTASPSVPQPPRRLGTAQPQASSGSRKLASGTIQGDTIQTRYGPVQVEGHGLEREDHDVRALQLPATIRAAEISSNVEPILHERPFRLRAPRGHRLRRDVHERGLCPVAPVSAGSARVTMLDHAAPAPSSGARPDRREPPDPRRLGRAVLIGLDVMGTVVSIDVRDPIEEAASMPRWLTSMPSMRASRL